MCIKNAMELSLKSDTFSSMKEDFDTILARTIGNMQMKGAEDATITLKLSVSLENTNAVIRGENEDITRPSFKHDISSVMQVKDKKSGALTGDYQLVWDDEERKYVMKRIDNGQISLFNEDGDVIEAEGNVIEIEPEEIKELPAPEDRYTPFDYLKQFIGEELKITEAMGNYAVRTQNDKIVLSSAFVHESPFYCDAEILKYHLEHTIACVGYGDDEIVNISIECEDCNEVLYSLDKVDFEEDSSDEEYIKSDEKLMEEVAEETLEEQEDYVEGDYQYDDPEEDEPEEL